MGDNGRLRLLLLSFRHLHGVQHSEHTTWWQPPSRARSTTGMGAAASLMARGNGRKTPLERFRVRRLQGLRGASVSQPARGVSHSSMKHHRVCLLVVLVSPKQVVV